MLDNKEKRVGSFGIKKSSSKSLLLPATTSLASIESLSMPQVHEIVLSADLRCVECQKKVAAVISRTTGAESVIVDILEKKVTLTYRTGMKESSNQVVSINRTTPLKIIKNFLYMVKS
ncbi:hypothetical protein IFM89_038928 [Coptis chinensis]|nr:hypothetical protein IFM89_038928 [Coptis chinensis]